MSKTLGRINPNRLKVRDPLMLKLLRGATKSGAHKDKKKEASRDACRGAREDTEDREDGAEVGEEEE